MDTYPHRLKHLKDHIPDNITVMSPHKPCKKTYDNLNSFTGHLSKQHKTVILTTAFYYENSSQSIEVEESNDNGNDDNELLDSFEHSAMDIDMSTNEKSIDTNDNFDSETNYQFPESVDDLCLSNFAQLYLSLECQYMIPARTLQYIVTEMCNCHQQSQDILKKNLRTRLLEEGFSDEKTVKILNEVFKSDLFLKSNNILGTHYKRIKFYKNNFSYVEPQQIMITPAGAPKQNFFHYVPIQERIQ